MKHTFFLVVLAAALAVGGFAVTHARAAEKSAPEMRTKIFQRIAQRLELTDEQKSAAKKVLAGEKATWKPLLAALVDARKNLRAAIRAGDANESSVRAASAKVASAEADLAVERMKLFAKLSPILTEEQRAKISEWEARMDGLREAMLARVGEGLAE
jgi:Spy/CpxP family protein refolding chaperone